MKVKYTSSKWFLENNGEWIEIDEKDVDKIILAIWHKTHLGNQIKRFKPTPDTEYQLDDIGFERRCKECNCIDPTICSAPKQVAHLKVEKKEQEVQIDRKVIRWEKHYSDGQVEFLDEVNSENFKSNLSIADGFSISRGYIKFKPVEWRKQEQSEVERLKEVAKDDHEIILTLQDKLEEANEKIKELENNLSQLEEHREELIAKLMNAEDKIKVLPKEEEQG